jgi:hypothetical protein
MQPSPAELPVECLGCGAAVEAGARVCAQCGRVLPSPRRRTCPACEHDADADATFCTACGQPFR